MFTLWLLLDLWEKVANFAFDSPLQPLALLLHMLFLEHDINIFYF